MESANQTKNATMGVVENLVFDVGCGELLLQVQVVEEANYEVLIGRPFFALTSCKTQDRINGDQTLTLTNPNNGKEITIPTQQWTKPCPRCSHGKQCTIHPDSYGKGF